MAFVVELFCVGKWPRIVGLSFTILEVDGPGAWVEIVVGVVVHVV